MMGRQIGEAQLFYIFSVDRHVPTDHLLRTKRFTALPLGSRPNSARVQRRVHGWENSARLEHHAGTRVRHNDIWRSLLCEPVENVEI